MFKGAKKENTGNRDTRVTEIFLPQTNGEISESIVQNWTLQAYECYSIGCNCKMCSINKGSYSFVCQMPKIVKALLEKQGEPNLKLIREHQAHEQSCGKELIA